MKVWLEIWPLESSSKQFQVYLIPTRLMSPWVHLFRSSSLEHSRTWRCHLASYRVQLFIPYVNFLLQFWNCLELFKWNVSRYCQIHRNISFIRVNLFGVGHSRFTFAVLHVRGDLMHDAYSITSKWDWTTKAGVVWSSEILPSLSPYKMIELPYMPPSVIWNGKHGFKNASS